MLDRYLSNFKGKTVGFIGLGVSNRPIFDAMLKNGIHCIVRDKKPLSEHPDFRTYEGTGAQFVCGEHYLDDIHENVMFLSPAVRPDIPQLLDAERNGTKMTSEMEEFFENCPCRTIGITGSDGKTTTTTLISLLLKASGHRVFLGGNIGANLLVSLDEMRPEDYAVVELSSFQLFKMRRSPDVAIVTNLSPNHLDWHGSMEEYQAAKTNILNFQNEHGIAVFNLDDPHTSEFAEKAKGAIRYISGEKRLENGVWFDEKGLHDGDKLILKDSDILAVGRHNRYNYAAAFSAVKDVLTEDALNNVARTFRGVEHRIEFVRELKGVKFFNSSIDSSPSRTKACLSSFKDKVIVICGGYDKKIPMDPLGPLFRDKVKYAVLCGATSEKIRLALEEAGFRSYEVVDDFEKAVNAACKKAVPGDSIVLSPASASFDQFRNFEERGNRFKQIVLKLS